MFGVIRNDLVVRADGDFNAAGFINDCGKAAVIQGYDGESVSKGFEDDGRGVLPDAGNAEDVTGAHDAEGFFPRHKTVEDDVVFQSQAACKRFPRFHARASAQHVKFHFFPAEGESVQKKVESFAGNMFSRPTQAQGGAGAV